MLSASLVVSEEAEIKQFRYILKSVQYDKVEDPNAEFFNRLSRYIEARKKIFAECGRDWCQEWWTFWKSSHLYLESTYPELLSALDEDLDKEGRKILFSENRYLPPIEQQQKEEGKEKKSPSLTDEQYDEYIRKLQTRVNQLAETQKWMSDLLETLKKTKRDVNNKK